MSPPRSLLLVSLGPVQSFIVTARKSSDLWFGSWLLSELARTAANAMLNDAELLVPDPGALQNKQAGVPARLVLRTKVGVDPKDVIDAANTAILTCLEKLLDDVRVRMTLDKHHPTVRDARAQLNDLPELHWVSVPWEDGAPFADAMRLADRLLTARKHHRPFNPPAWGSGHLKSSVDGARESVLDQALTHRLRDDPKKLWETLRVRPGEQLCGPGLLKRWAPVACDKDVLGDGARTMSTSHIASWSLRRAWKDAEEGSPLRRALKASWRRYIDALKSAAHEEPDEEREDKPRFRTGVKDLDRLDPVLDDYDGGLLYPSRLPDVLNLKTQDSATIEKAERALKQLIDDWNKTLAEHSRPALSPVGAYYAVVAADGDHLGNTLQRLSLTEIKKVSNNLLTFARKAREIVEGLNAQVVYIGGDDLLLLAPVETVMECCAKLSDTFNTMVGIPAAATLTDEIKAELYGDPTRHPTLSVGVCIAHHLDPFQESVAAAREAETRAKTKGGRNAFAVTLRPRSGPPTEIVGPWDRYETLQALQKMFSDDKLPESKRGADGEGQRSRPLPGGLPYDLRDAADAVPKGDDAGLKKLRVLEAKRVITQKGLTTKAPTPEELAAHKRDPKAHRLRPRDAPGDVLVTLLDDATFTPRELADWLRVARLLSKNEEDRP